MPSRRRLRQSSFRPLPTSEPRRSFTVRIRATDRATSSNSLATNCSPTGPRREAIVAFRQWTYLSPDNPVAHFQLALALDDRRRDVDGPAGVRRGAHRARPVRSGSTRERSAGLRPLRTAAPPRRPFPDTKRSSRQHVPTNSVGSPCLASGAPMKTMVCFRTSQGRFALPIESTLVGQDDERIGRPTGTTTPTSSACFPATRL